MGVETRIVLYAADSGRAVTAARSAFARIAELDAILSDYRDDSELMRLTAAPPGSWVPVSEPLWRVLAAAQELAHQSNGAFDITAGPYVRLWREARRSKSLPDRERLRAAASRTGGSLLELDSTTRRVRLGAAGMQLDLGGIAKGFAADEAVRILHAHGLTRVLVEMGGDIVVGAPPPDRSGWQIRLAEPGDAPPVLELANAAISTSGDAVQFVEIDGIRYSHVIDPRTGIALRDRIVATVVAPTALLSDPLATILGVLGPDEGARLLTEKYPEVTFYVRRREPRDP